MKKTILLLVLTAIPLMVKSQQWEIHGRLTVDLSNPHYIQYQDGTPFLWFGDTGWEMIHRLSREEVKVYLEDRRAKGFNVIQTVILSEFFNEKPVNFYGDSLFTDFDAAHPLITEGADPMNNTEYDFWDHVEYTVKTAAEKGIYLALFPTWGEWVIPRVSKARFNTAEETYKYGWFVADRLEGYKNIIWMLGGDRHPDEREGGADLWRAMAEGIADATNSVVKYDGVADYSTTFMSHHSYSSSSQWFHNDVWIDFHMWGSYHADFYVPRSWQIAVSDWNLKDPKPTINGEPNYEDHPVNYALENNSFFAATDIRMAAYWSIFSGCAGFTYGAHTIWQFTDHARPPHNRITNKTWQECLDLPGTFDVILLKRLIESFPVRNLIPDQSMIIGGQGQGSDYIAAIRGESHALFYIPKGNAITVRLGKIKGENIESSWFDPRTGRRTVIGIFKNSGDRSFVPPGISGELSWLRTGRGCDWVLVLKGTPVSG